jgi:hypothetical protein
VGAIGVPGAPVAVTLVRAYHVCLGEYAALFRLEGVSSSLVTQLVLDREWWSLDSGGPPRRDQQVLAQSFEKGTVRYLRIQWREGLANRGERVLRLRLARAYLAEGPPFEAGPWPSLPPPTARIRTEGLGDKLGQVREGVMDVTRKIREATKKLEQSPIVRHRPADEPKAPPP